MLAAFRSNEIAGACVDSIISSGIIPVALEFMDRPAIHACEAFAHAGYPLDAEAMLIIEVEGSAAEQDDLLARIRAICERHDPISLKVSQSAGGIAGDLEGPQGRVRRGRPDQPGLSVHGRHDPDHRGCPTCCAASARCRDAYGLKVANIFHAGDGNLHPLIMFDANDPGELPQGGKIRRRHPEALRRGRRLPDRRARRRRGEARADAGAVHRARAGAAAPHQVGVRSGLAAEPQQGVSAGATHAALPHAA